MDYHLLQNISFTVDRKSLLDAYHIEYRSNDFVRISELIDEAESIAGLKALYKIAFIDSKSNNGAVIDGVDFQSRVLRINLENAHRVFPFIATCGQELEEWSKPINDILEQYWVDTIKEQAVIQAVEAVQRDLQMRYHPGMTSSMNPGSLEDWPMSEQVKLFSLFGDPAETIGVKLTDSFLMVPIKSISGLTFPTETQFESCQLCPRKNCSGRRVPFDPILAEEKYQVKRF